LTLQRNEVIKVQHSQTTIREAARHNITQEHIMHMT